MSFETVNLNSLGRSQTKPDQIYIAIYGSRSKGAPRSITLRIGKGIAEKLGWNAGSGLAILEGSGKDIGRAKLLPHDAGAKLMPTNPQKPNGDLFVSLPIGSFAFHEFPEIRNSEPVKAQAFNGEVLIELPEWVIKKQPVIQPAKARKAAK